MVIFQIFQNILGFAGQRIGSRIDHHIAHLVIGIDLMGHLHCQGTGHKHVMQTLPALLRNVRLLLTRRGISQVIQNTLIQQCAHRTDGAVDLIKGQPILDLSLIPGKDSTAVVEEVVDHLPGHPGIALFRQPKGDFIVGNGDQRFDAVFMALLNHFLIMLQTGFVGN